MGCPDLYYCPVIINIRGTSGSGTSPTNPKNIIARWKGIQSSCKQHAWVKIISVSRGRGSGEIIKLLTE